MLGAFAIVLFVAQPVHPVRATPIHKQAPRSGAENDFSLQASSFSFPRLNAILTVRRAVDGGTDSVAIPTLAGQVNFLLASISMILTST